MPCTISSRTALPATMCDGVKQNFVFIPFFHLFVSELESHKIWKSLQWDTSTCFFVLFSKTLKVKPNEHKKRNI